jgi:hypothetical protein
VEYRTGLQLEALNIWIHKELGNALWETGHREEALREYESVAARAVAVGDSVAAHTLGWPLMCLGDHDRAASCFNRELTSTPDPLAPVRPWPELTGGRLR